MGKLTEKVAYLQGLAEGLKISEGTSEGRLITEMLQVMALMADAQDLQNDVIDDLIESVDRLGDDLSDMEDLLLEEVGLNGYDDDEDFLCLECPECHDAVYFDFDVLDGDEDLTCPNCGAELSLELPDLDGEDEED